MSGVLPDEIRVIAPEESSTDEDKLLIVQ